MPDFNDVGIGLIGGLQKGLMSYYDQKQQNERDAAEMAAKGLIRQDNKWIKDPNEVRQERIKRRNENAIKLIDQGIMPREESFDEEGNIRLDTLTGANFGKKAQDEELRQLQLQKLRKEIHETPGKKKLDEQFATDYQNYLTGGGFASSQKNLSNLENAANKLESGEVKTGGIKGLLPQFVQDVVSPEISAIRSDIEGAVQGELKQVLGSQFTEKEGQKIFERSFNSRLSSAENARRTKATIDVIRKMGAVKAAAGKYFEEHGTLEGFSGSDLLQPGALYEAVNQKMIELESPKKQSAKPMGLIQNKSSAQAGKFPMTIRKDGHTAQVNNAQELKEAQAEGWQ